MGFRQKTALEKWKESWGWLWWRCLPGDVRGHLHLLSRPRGELWGVQRNASESCRTRPASVKVQERGLQHTEPGLNPPPLSDITSVPCTPTAQNSSGLFPNLSKSPTLQRPQTQLLGVSSLSTLTLWGFRSCSFQDCVHSEDTQIYISSGILPSELQTLYSSTPSTPLLDGLVASQTSSAQT